MYFVQNCPKWNETDMMRDNAAHRTPSRIVTSTKAHVHWRQATSLSRLEAESRWW